MKKRAKRGAYRKPEEKRNNKVTVLLTGDELAKIESARKEKGQCRSSFIRDSLIPNSSLMDFLRRNVGKAVVIDWVNPEDDWFYFRILDVKNKDEILIKGMDSPGWTKHKGDEFLVSADDIKSIGLRDADEEEIKDGFGGVWSAWCCACGEKSMRVCRPGKVQCSNCD